jgi:hypothetical protein
MSGEHPTRRAATCVAEMPVQLWEAESERDESQDVRCVRPEGHEGKHSGVITWGGEVQPNG